MVSKLLYILAFSSETISKTIKPRKGGMVGSEKPKMVELSNLRDAVRSQEQLEAASHVSLSLSLAHCIHLPPQTVFLIVREHSYQCLLFLVWT